MTSAHLSGAALIGNHDGCIKKKSKTCACVCVCVSECVFVCVCVVGGVVSLEPLNPKAMYAISDGNS